MKDGRWSQAPGWCFHDMEPKPSVAPVNLWVEHYGVYHRPLHPHFLGEKSKLIKYMSKSHTASNQQRWKGESWL